MNIQKKYEYTKEIKRVDEFRDTGRKLKKFPDGIL